MQKVLIFEKKKCSAAGFEPATSSLLLYPLSYMAMVFDEILLEFSPLYCLQPAAERKLITTLTRGDKLKVGG